MLTEIIIFVLSITSTGCLISFHFLKKDKKNQEVFFNYQAEIKEKSNLLLDKEKENNELKSAKEKYQKKLHEAEILLASLRVEHKNLENKNQELHNFSDKMNKDFENLAFKIFNKSQKELTDINQNKINDILKPFSEKISDFKNLVKDSYEKEVRDKSALKNEVQKLLELNHKLSLDAENLTKALKGDNKFQGNWGEVILEKILERSGLREGIEYVREKSGENDIGERIRPDVIINLPQQRQIIIDSKLSLKSYEEYANQEDNNLKNILLKQHINSVKNHIKNLSDKNYLTNSSGYNLDFLIIFIPIEGSYNLIMQHEAEIFWYGFEKKILLLGPATLNSTLQIISSLWRQEKISKNSEEIAKQAGALYDRFVDFLGDLDKVKKAIESSDKNLNSALHKLQSGKFSMFNRFEKIKTLGAKTTKDSDKLNDNQIKEENGEKLEESA